MYPFFAGWPDYRITSTTRPKLSALLEQSSNSGVHRYSVKQDNPLTQRRLVRYSTVGRMEVETSAMNQPSTIVPASASPPPMDSIDTATLQLLAAWTAEDAT